MRKPTRGDLKQEFFDAIFMRYGWQMKRLPVKCACQASFSIEHALSCHLGGYIIHRHNNIRDALATMLKEVSHDVKIEPALSVLVSSNNAGSM